jgi:Protein of unknown function (DUF3341)
MDMAERVSEQEVSGLMAEFDSDVAIVAAAKALTERGFRKLDGFTPRPVEALQDLLVPERSTLPRSVLIAALIGVITGLGTQWFCNTWDYPLNVGGRPAFSLPAFIPITFEIMVLFASLTAFFGALQRARLPHLTHPVFAVANFESASIDHFWLFVSADDVCYRDGDTEQLLRDAGCVSLVEAPAGGPWIKPAIKPELESEPTPRGAKP